MVRRVRMLGKKHFQPKAENYLNQIGHACHLSKLILLALVFACLVFRNNTYLMYLQY
jgi:hypothetical protein